MTVHGDDFSSTGCEKDLKWFEAMLEKTFEIKTEFLGPNAKRHAQEVRILNRMIRWTASGFEYDSDQRHADLIT